MNIANFVPSLTTGVFLYPSNEHCNIDSAPVTVMKGDDIERSFQLGTGKCFRRGNTYRLPSSTSRSIAPRESALETNVPIVLILSLVVIPAFVSSNNIIPSFHPLKNDPLLLFTKNNDFSLPSSNKMIPSFH